MRDYAWDHRTSVSKIVRDILENAGTDLRHYDDWPDNIHGNTQVVTIYVPDDSWDPVKAKALSGGVTMSSIIRKGFLATLEYDSSEV